MERRKAVDALAHAFLSKLRKATKQKYQQLVGRLTETTLRLWVAAEAMSLGRGGITLVAGATGLSRTTIHAGIKELEQPLGKERSGLGTACRRIDSTVVATDGPGGLSTRPPVVDHRGLRG
jgi:hypothetical protein